MTIFLGYFLIVLIALQGLAMMVDEFIFHRRRGLERFERWGHVADTGLFFLALLVPALAAPSGSALLLYGFLAISSSLLITKDEWVHAAACKPFEQWCHAVLFVLHGPILMTVGLLWYLAPEITLFHFLPLAVFSWGFYQFYYWNIYYDGKSRSSGREQSLLR